MIRDKLHTEESPSRPFRSEAMFRRMTDGEGLGPRCGPIWKALPEPLGVVRSGSRLERDHPASGRYCIGRFGAS
jgi:hypothetical protein